MKKDVIIALTVIVLAFGLTYGIAATRVPLPMRPTQPFTTDERVASIPTTGPETAPVGRVIMRVNGEPITESEFSAMFSSLPAEMQQQFASEQGKQAFAEQLVRLKVLEQEARRMKLENDPKIAGQISAQRSDTLANAAAVKLVEKVSPEAVKKFYDQNKQQLQTVELSHIVVAYQGGAIPPKNGGQPLDERAAVNKALQIYQQLKEGAKFEDLAKKESDDTATGARGGVIGPVAPGMLPQELDARVMNMREGEISTAIPSRYGIHIFKVGKRVTRPLAEVQDRIAARVRQEETIKKIEDLRKAAKVDYDPKFFPDAKNWQHPPQPAKPPA